MLPSSIPDKQKSTYLLEEQFPVNELLSYLLEEALCPLMHSQPPLSTIFDIPYSFPATYFGCASLIWIGDALALVRRAIGTR